jgi:hypothetical protein
VGCELDTKISPLLGGKVGSSTGEVVSWVGGIEAILLAPSLGAKLGISLGMEL